MDRREAIKRTSRIMGIAISSPVITAIIEGCTIKNDINWIPSFLTKDQAILVGQVAERILPSTDTPGALDVGVDAFIDVMLRDCYKKAHQENFLSGVRELEEISQASFEKPFADCDHKHQDALLKKLENDSETWKKDGKSSERPFFLIVKELTLLGYFTSEEIMKNHLEYNPIPGRFDGCIPMDKNQKLRVGN